MRVAVILDIVIVALPALFMYLGWKRGLFRSLAELAAIDPGYAGYIASKEGKQR